MNNYFLLLGSNLGDRFFQLATALEQLAIVGKVERSSSIYETEAWGKTDQPAFLNQVVEFKCDKDSSQLLEVLLEIEQKMGRLRETKWAERTLDMDILFCGSDIVDLPDLQIPHPSLHLRRFTLVPLVELAPEMVHPTLNKTVSQLLDKCPDTLDVNKLEVVG